MTRSSKVVLREYVLEHTAELLCAVEDGALDVGEALASAFCEGMRRALVDDIARMQERLP